MKFIKLSKKKTSNIKKKFCILMCAVFMILPMSVSGNTIDSVESQRAEIARQQSELDAQLDVLKNDKAEKEAYSDLLIEKINLTEQNIDLLMTNIDTLNESIDFIQGKIDLAENEYEETFDLLKDRLVSLYETGSVGTIEILMNSTSLHEFALKREAIQVIGDYDSKLISEIQAFTDETQGYREELDEKKAQVAEDKIKLEEDRAELEKIYAENEDLIADIDSKQAEIDAQQAQLDADDASLRIEIERLLQIEQEKQAAAEAAAKAEQEKLEQEKLEQEQQENEENSDPSDDTQPETDEGETSQPDEETGTDEDTQTETETETEQEDSTDDTTTSTGSGYLETEFNAAWPVPGYGSDYITSYYGPRWGRIHYGIDIGAGYGVPIVATETGKVVSAREYGSYGEQVLIYHNDTYTSRYAHLSSYAVSEGDFVVRGQVIGYMGSTGFSTGNHLHFEIIVNGSALDPLLYL